MRVSEGASERVATGRVRVSGWDLRISEMRVKVRENTCERARGESVVLKSFACDMSDWEGA